MNTKPKVTLNHDAELVIHNTTGSGHTKVYHTSDGLVFDTLSPTGDRVIAIIPREMNAKLTVDVAFGHGAGLSR